MSEWSIRLLLSSGRSFQRVLLIDFSAYHVDLFVVQHVAKTLPLISYFEPSLLWFSFGANKVRTRIGVH